MMINLCIYEQSFAMTNQMAFRNCTNEPLIFKGKSSNAGTS